MRVLPLPVTVLVLVLVGGLATAVRADQTYVTTGSDNFSIGAGDIKSEVSFRGRQTLRVEQHDHLTRYSAHVAYIRSDGPARSGGVADYTADVLATGEAVATADHDPDYLTVLNQPFAAQLDAQTLRDLRHLHGRLPFDFPSPVTGPSLHGFLEHPGGGAVGKRATLGVRFEATGPMHGALPDRPGLTLEGTIAMRGTAYYDVKTALLLALETTVTISGNVSNRSSKDPVRIVYTRKLRAARGPATPS